MNLGFTLIALVVGAHLLKLLLPEFTFWEHVLLPKNVQLILIAGGACVALSLAMGILKPIHKVAATNRCVRCKKPIPKGDIYCRDHLKEVVNEAKDHQR